MYLSLNLVSNLLFSIDHLWLKTLIYVEYKTRQLEQYRGSTGGAEYRGRRVQGAESTGGAEYRGRRVQGAQSTGGAEYRGRRVQGAQSTGGAEYTGRRVQGKEEEEESDPDCTRKTV